MAISYVHLSDIHFGQEQGGDVIVHNDVKERLLDDLKDEVAKLPQQRASGVIVTGDIAYGGKAHEYAAAGDWLDRVARAAGCQITDIQVVPGNHDIDRAEITEGTKMMLDRIVAGGEPALDTFLKAPRDRELLYGRFSSYRPFAEAYNCSLDCEGGLASDKVVELAPGRRLRFIGLNSAILCSKGDAAGTLLLGAKQRVLPVEEGQELIVLSHHPLHWFRDSEDARKYIRNRARVLVTGHEHTPRAKVDPVKDGCDLLMIEAGAVVPPRANEIYKYGYNLLTFDWIEKTESLGVTIEAREWSDDTKEFAKAAGRLGSVQSPCVLGCPAFLKASGRKAQIQPLSKNERDQAQDSPKMEKSAQPVAAVPTNEVPPEYPLALLRFFRDLTAVQRLAILIGLGALPTNFEEPLTNALERRTFDLLVRKGRMKEISEAIKKSVS